VKALLNEAGANEVDAHRAAASTWAGSTRINDEECGVITILNVLMQNNLDASWYLPPCLVSPKSHFFDTAIYFFYDLVAMKKFALIKDGNMRFALREQT
jgi:hypothetical protein